MHTTHASGIFGGKLRAQFLIVTSATGTALGLFTRLAAILKVIFDVTF
jgi:hypothetical protein